MTNRREYRDTAAPIMSPSVREAAPPRGSSWRTARSLLHRLQPICDCTADEPSIKTYSLDEVAAIVLPSKMKYGPRWPARRISRGDLSEYGLTTQPARQSRQSSCAPRRKAEELPVLRSSGGVVIAKLGRNLFD